MKSTKIWYRSANILYNIQTLNPQAKRAQGITLYYFDEYWHLIQLISAKEVEMHGEKWNLSKGSLTLFTPESSFPLTRQFDHKTIVMISANRRVPPNL